MRERDLSHSAKEYSSKAGISSKGFDGPSVRSILCSLYMKAVCCVREKLGPSTGFAKDRGKGHRGDVEYEALKSSCREKEKKLCGHEKYS